MYENDTPFWTEYVSPNHKGYQVDWHATKGEAMAFAKQIANETGVLVEVSETRPEGVIRHANITTG